MESQENVQGQLYTLNYLSLVVGEVLNIVKITTFFFLSVKIIYSSWGFSGFLCSVFIGFFHWFWFLGLAVMVVSILFCDVALAGTDHAPRMVGYQLFATPPPRTSWVLRLQAACATVLSWFCFAVFSLTCFPSCFV